MRRGEGLGQPPAEESLRERQEETRTNRGVIAGELMAGLGCGVGGGAVAFSDKSSNTHPFIYGGLRTEPRLERVLERVGSEKEGKGKCSQL